MEFVTSGWPSSLAQSAAFLLILWLCRFVGGNLLDRLTRGGLTKLENTVLGAGLGLFILGMLFYFAGLAGYLNRLSAAAVLMLLMVAGYLFRVRKALPRSIDLPALFFSLPVFFLSWLSAVAPEIGNDALAYHLAHPAEFVRRGSFIYLEGTRESLWPYLTESLYTLGLLLGGTGLAKLFHWAYYPLTCAAIYAFLERIRGRRAARIGGMVFLFVPAAFAQSGYAYVDLSLAFYVFASAYPLLWDDRGKDVRAACVSAIFMGAALSVKYLALGAFLAMAAAWLLRVKRVRPVVVFAALAALTASVWYLRSWAELGNPVYPFFYEIFGGNGYPNKLGEEVGLGRTPLSLLLLPWNLTMRPSAYGGEQIGPLFLAFVPACLFLRVKQFGPRGQALLCFAAVYGFFIFTQSQQARFFLSVVPFLSVAAATGILACLKIGSWPRRAAIACLTLFFAAQSLIFVYRSRDVLGVWIQRIPAEEYLLRRERSFEGWRFFLNHSRKGDRIFNGAEAREFYGAGLSTVLYNEIFAEKLKTQGMSVERYLDEGKFRYLWLRKNLNPHLWSYAQTRYYQQVHNYVFYEGGAQFSFYIFERSIS